MVQMAQFSLAERVRLVNMLHPTARMTVYGLRKLYRSHGVTYKAVAFKRCWRRPDDLVNIAKDEVVLANMRLRVSQLQHEKREIIFVDECLFTQQTFKKQAWMTRYANVELRRRSTGDSGPCACLGAISAERGLVTFLLRQKSIKQGDFAEFLQQLRNVSGDQPLHLVLDNCTVHHAKSVKNLAAALQIELIFLRPYSP